MLISRLIVSKKIIAVYCKNLTPHFERRAGRSEDRISAGKRDFVFSKTPRPDLEHIQIHTEWIQAFFPFGKTAWAWCWPLTFI